MSLAVAIASFLILFLNPAVTGADMGFKIWSADFKEGQRVPKAHTCEGGDTSPVLAWQDPPKGTKSYVLVVEDPDAPSGTFVHWIVFDIPGSSTGLERGAGKGATPPAMHGRTSFGRAGYGGPCPPPGHGTHRYFFRLKALDIDALGLEQGAGRQDIDRAIKGHVLKEAETMGTYSR